MKGTFSAVIATPSTIYTNANNSISAYQFYVDCNALLSGDTLKVVIKTDTTNTIRQSVTDYITIDNLGEDKVAIAFPLLLDANDTYSVVLEQTTGTGRTFPWSVNVVEYA